MSDKDRLFSYLRPQLRLIVTALVSALVFVLANLSIPLLVGRSLDAIGTMTDNVFVVNPDIDLIVIYAVVALVLVVLGTIFDFVFEYQVGVFSQRLVKQVRDDLFRKMNSAPIKTLDERALGDMVQLEIQDVENLSNGIFSVFKQLLQGILSIVVTIIMMFTVNWILALGVIVLTPLSFFVSRFVASFSHRHFKKQSELQGKLSGISLETINNLETVKSLSFEDRSIEQFEKADSDLRDEAKVAQFSSSWTNPSTRLVNNTIYAIIGIAGIIMVLMTSSYPILNMTIGKLTSFLSYTNEYTKPFNEISSVAAEFETARSSFKRINGFLNTADDIDEGRTILDRKVDEIAFDHMYFSYDSNRPLIEDFCETIHRGEKVAIVGPTGAGKTTIINVLMRFYDPVSGSIDFDSVDSTRITKKSLRSNFGMVLQDTWIFSGTVRENIMYARPDATEEELYEATRKSHADSFIQTLPDGYETFVTSKSGLSEGERQLIAIARVMLRQPDIVILDEATSNIDTRTEVLINEAFDEMMEGRTSIVIAHRLSTIQKADLILVLKDGHIIESGNHSELMEKKGFYYEMYTSQFK